MGDKTVLRVDFEGWAKVVPLDGPVTVGRGAECAVRLPDPRLSRQHAVFRPTPVGGCEVEDLGSQAGTRVGGEPVTGPRGLKVGDRVEVGPITVEIALDTPQVTVAPEAANGAAPQDAALLGVVVDLFSSPDLPTLLLTVVDRAIALAGAERGAVMVRAQGGLETSIARDSRGNDLAADLLLSRSMAKRAFESGQTVVVTDFGDDAEAPGSVVAQGLRAVVCAPLPGPGHSLGVLYLDAKHAVARFGPDRIAMLEALATHATLAIERARMRDDGLQREADRRATLEAENASLRARLSDGAPIGSSPGMRRATELVRQLSSSDVTVCLTGETGTGKEVFARWLHKTSSRAGRPFVAVDCGSIPEGLIESELFGHVKGAFTGASTNRLGHFREADGGTLFLDEIGELPIALQTRLLRVLQERTVQPVGATGRIPVDVRVVSATHRDLERSVAEGSFRQDLFYRLAVVRIELPPLRERGDDILLLAHRFLMELGKEHRRTYEGFAPDARRALLTSPWPGNVRELQHRVQRAVVLGKPPYITAEDLGLTDAQPLFQPMYGPQGSQTEPDGPLKPLIEARADATARFERHYVEQLLSRTAGNMSAAAELAGVTRQAVHRLVAMHGIDRKRFRHGRPTEKR